MITLTRKQKRNTITAIAGAVVGGVVITAIGKSIMEAGVTILTGVAVGGAIYGVVKIATAPVRRLRHVST